ncbi:hypothetical protein MNBD_GAMMA05-689 [hydrothermal vent metagenome]|uniref:Flagellar FliJ protein n=1 Tax=hydrothermal vent metagenome TaxID=652676 RepID=A0A3B0X605_9ZZZZ
MSDLKETRSLVDKAHREEVKAFNKMVSDEEKAKEQQSQLETCITYRDECSDGLRTAKSSGLSVVQVRECQLLMQYLDSVVETRQYKADISSESYEKLKAVWTKKNDHYEQLKTTLEKQEIEDRERRENTMVGGDESDKSMQTETYFSHEEGK